jgi:hypothetical protein
MMMCECVIVPVFHGGTGTNTRDKKKITTPFSSVQIFYQQELVSDLRSLISFS